MSVFTPTGSWVYGGANTIQNGPTTGNSSSFLVFNNSVNTSFSLSTAMTFYPIYSGTGTASIDGYFGAGLAFDIVSTGDNTYPYQYCAVYLTNFAVSSGSIYTFNIVLTLSTGNRTGATGFPALTTSVITTYNLNNPVTLAVKRLGSYIQVLFNGNTVNFPSFYSNLSEASYNTPSWATANTYVLAEPQQNQVLSNSVGLYMTYSGSTPPVGASAESCTWSNVILYDYEYDRSTDFDIVDVSALGGVKTVDVPYQFTDNFTDLSNWQ